MENDGPIREEVQEVWEDEARDDLQRQELSDVKTIEMVERHPVYMWRFSRKCNALWYWDGTDYRPDPDLRGRPPCCVLGECMNPKPWVAIKRVIGIGEV